MSAWFASVFAKFSRITPTVWAILAALLLIGIVITIMTKQNKKWSASMLANGAMSIALAFILSYIRLYSLPQGGSVTAGSMLPIFLFAYAYGVQPGMVAGFAYGFLQFIQDGIFVNPIELILDYPLAFAMLGLAGLASGKKQGIIGSHKFSRFLCICIAILTICLTHTFPLLFIRIVFYLLAAILVFLAFRHVENDFDYSISTCIVLGSLGRFICAFIAGIVFFGSYAPEGQPVYLYSAIYNGSYLIIDTAICIALSLSPSIQRLARSMARTDR